MLKYHLKIALRYLLKNRAYSIINIFGLGIGLMSFLVIFLWVRDEQSYDRFHEEYRNIYRIWWNDDLPQTRTPHPMTYTMRKDFPEVKNAVSLSPVWGAGLTQPDRTVKYGELSFEENRIYAADTTFFDIFSFSMLKGNPKTALNDVGSIVINQSMAKKYFLDEDPLGKIITINFGFDAPFTVTGVIDDIPDNAHFHFDFLLSYVTLKAYERGNYYEWVDFGHYNYILLNPGANVDELENKMASWALNYLDWNETAKNELLSGRIGFKLQPLKDIHLRSHLKWELEPNGDISSIYIFSAIGILILVIACINFVNLTIARSSIRKIEVGIKKTMGASRISIQVQFLIETFLSTLIAVMLAIILFELLIPVINNIIDKQLALDLQDPFMIVTLISLFAFCGLLAGFYPSLVLSKMLPSSMVKSRSGNGKVKSYFNRILIIFQFSASIFLIISTLIISRQVNYLGAQKLGFNSEHVLVIPIKDTLMARNYAMVENEFKSDQRVLEVSAVSNIPGRRFNQNPIQWESAQETESASELRVDYNFFKTLDLEMINGREFSLENPSDLENAFIINEAAAQQFDWPSPIGEKVLWYDETITRRGEVIGVVKDFHFQSLHTSIEPLIIQLNLNALNYFLVKVNASNLQVSIDHLKHVYEKRDPAHAFNYFFLDDDINSLYLAEARTQKIVGYLTILAIVISCIGLFGLASYTAERRTKEIGIRKVNGASNMNIISMMSREFIAWIFFSFLFAVPVSILFIESWLRHFAYHTNSPIMLFVIAGSGTLVIALFTVGFQAYKAASKNIVETLRYE